MTPNYDEDQLLVLLSNMFDYKIFVHDNHYYGFLFGLQSILLDMHPNKTSKTYYRLALTEVHELDLPADPCNPDPDYQFQACVKESLSSQVGCRSRWDTLSDQDRPLCTEMKQYR